jgi:type IV pilus assembly protein PilY1
MVYVGANDGMLHAFLLAKYREVTKADGTTEKKWIYDPAEDPDTSGPKIGEELWAYIPSNLLTELKNLEDSNYGVGDCKHRPMVDLSPRSWEVFIKSANCPAKTTHPELTDDLGRCWRTVVVGGERGGGDMYFALDVTDPHNPEVLWEYSVFRNRIVVEAQDTLNDSCFQPCKNACATKQECVDIYNNCVTTNHCATLWPRRLRSQCYANCTALQDQCIAQCESACRTACSTTTYKAYMPFDNDARYRTIKVIPMSWSQPYLGRIKVPDDVKFFVGPPSNAGDLITGGYPQNTFEFAPTGTPDVPSGTTSPFTVTLENQRSVVFMGGGIRIFDRDFDVPGFTSTEMRFKTALFWPFLIMMDIETGYNLFEYVWPMVVLKNSSVFPLVTTGTASNPFYVPYAMSDPLALDLWDQDTDTIGDDGFIDRVYVGDMNGYLYGVKFNLDPQVKDASGALVNNSNFGILVELWPTKPIDSGDLDMNLYRGRRQPITVQPASTFVKRSDSIYVIFGTGKYDDIFTDLDDKTDTSKMSLYNVKDVVSLPDLTGGYEVFDTSHPTGFKMKFENMCPGVTFDTGCTWFDQGSDPPRGDCCESGNSTCTNPCYACIYDLTLPTGDTGGERIVGKPLIAGGLVFVTSFVPPDETCDFSGEGYLYVFDAACIPLEDVTTIIPGASSPALVALGFGSGATRVDYGLRLSLGAGMPSRPVLDSRGENVIIQMSDGTLKRIGVGLPGKPVQVKGWRATR